MTSLHLTFNTKLKHPAELAAIKAQGYQRFLAGKFDDQANAEEQRELRALIDDLTTNQSTVIVDCLPVALTKDARHVMRLDVYDLAFSTDQIQAIVEKHYPVIADGQPLTIKLHDQAAEFQIEMTNY